MSDEHRPGIIRRVANSDIGDLTAIESSVRSATFEPAVERAKFAGQIRELREEVQRPLNEIIASDEAAAKALSKLVDLDRMRVSRALEGDRGRQRRGFGTVASLDVTGMFSSYALPLGWTVFAPPYDEDGTPDSVGDPTDVEPSAATGWATANCPLAFESHGFRAASARIALIVRPSTFGTVEVRPWIEVTYDWFTNGQWLSAYSHGEVATTVVAEPGPEVVAQSHATLWDYESEDMHSDSGWEAFGWQNPNVTFAGSRDRTYTLWFSATASGDQSGDRAIGGVSYFESKVAMWVRHVGVGLRQ